MRRLIGVLQIRFSRTNVRQQNRLVLFDRLGNSVPISRDAKRRRLRPSKQHLDETCPKCCNLQRMHFNDCALKRSKKNQPADPARFERRHDGALGSASSANISTNFSINERTDAGVATTTAPESRAPRSYERSQLFSCIWCYSFTLLSIRGSN